MLIFQREREREERKNKTSLLFHTREGGREKTPSTPPKNKQKFFVCSSNELFHHRPDDFDTHKIKNQSHSDWRRYRSLFPWAKYQLRTFARAKKKFVNQYGSTRSDRSKNIPRRWAANHQRFRLSYPWVRWRSTPKPGTLARQRRTRRRRRCSVVFFQFFWFCFLLEGKESVPDWLWSEREEENSVSKNARKRCQNKPKILIEREENLNKHFLYSNRRSHFRFTTRECMF